jgi:release factor glutamine methyltransferase
MCAANSGRLVLVSASSADAPIESFVVEKSDWLDVLVPPFRSEFLTSIRELPIRTARRFPPPKRGRVPFGHELRVLRRFLSGESTLFDPSAFAPLYRRAASQREQLFYQALIQSEALSRAEWDVLLGPGAAGAWIDKELVREGDGGLWCRFCVYAIGDVLLIGDTERTRLLRRVLVGQDSFMMAEFMRERRLPHVRRYLDVGPGSGVVLLSVSPHADERMGLDINPRAVEVSRLNAELNGIECRVLLEDAIQNGAAHGPFELVTWNTPFVHLPPECKDTHFDGYGGELGMEVLLNFIRVLPDILTADGRCFLAAAAPILRSGENLLEPELAKLAGSLGLDITLHITQSYWHTLYRAFQERSGIRRFEHSFLELSRGSGRVQRAEAPLASRLADRARGFAFSLWK